MTLVTRKQFGILCGDDEKKINVYVTRDKISTYPLNTRLIDTENPKNVAFKQYRRGENFLNPLSPDVTFDPESGEPSNPIRVQTPRLSTSVLAVTPKVAAVKVPKPDKPDKVKKTKEVKEKPVKEHPQAAEAVKQPKEIQKILAMQMARDMKKVDQDQQKTDKNLELTDLRIQREQLLLNKSAGKLLPVELAEGVIKRHGSTIFKEFEKGIERLGTLFCTIMAGGDPTMKKRIMTEGKKMLSLCVVNAGKAAELEIDTLVDEYSESLLRGQKKV